MMKNSHRVNVLVTSCLKTPVDPHTKVPAASYERERAKIPHYIHNDKEIDYDTVSDPEENDAHAKDSSPLPIKNDRTMSHDHIDLQEFYRSSIEYYNQLEELRRAHLQAMSELELMYRKKLDLNGIAALSSSSRACPAPWDGLTLREKTKRAQSAHELRSGITKFHMGEQQLTVNDDCADPVSHCIHQGFSISSKEQIRNMWKEFSVDKQSPCHRHCSSTKPQNHPPNCQAMVQTKTRGQKGKQEEQNGWRPRVTVPKPFKMTLREAELKSKGVRSRSEIERENEELRLQIEELTECQRKFRASSVPAHVRLPLYEELQERDEERRCQLRAADQQRLRDSQRPFSFLEREHAKKAQKEKQLQEQKKQEERRRNMFRAKPVPNAVKEAALGEWQKEEALYREIKKFMRAREMLLGASMPPSRLAKRLAERRAQKADQLYDNTNHRPRINTQVPDFDASYRRFQKQLEGKRESRPVTTCEPFDLSTANFTSHKDCNTTDAVRRKNPLSSRCPFVTSSPRTSSSSLCSSLSGSQEYLPTKITDAAKKRQDAVRKVLEQRKKAEEEKERWQERQKQKERKLQKLIAKRAQANDPHMTLAQTYRSKLEQFRKQDLQRRREFQEEMKGIQERVNSRPLLLERVAQTNAKLAAERCYTEALHKCGLSEAFVCSKAPKSHRGEERSQSHTPPTYREDRILDDLGGLDADSLSGDYPADYEDYEQDVEDKPVVRENIMHTEDEEKDDNKRDTDEEGDDRHSDTDNLDCDHYYSDQEKSDGESDLRGRDRSHSLHSNTSRESDDGERSRSALKGGDQTEDRKSSQNSPESYSGDDKTMVEEHK
ncbi:protein FAM161A [Trichomycterus rosablanca]|uniref:protein FAM161A n=1 Tax=Trichomycterus rosablanca TaxID=2290929 RepID=UPI002F35C884